MKEVLHASAVSLVAGAARLVRRSRRIVVAVSVLLSGASSDAVPVPTMRRREARRSPDSPDKPLQLPE